MKNLKFIGTFIMLVVFTSCDKNQTAVRKLDGKWQVTEATASNGAYSTTTTYSSNNEFSYTFDNCKLKKEEYCNVAISQIIYGSNVSINQQYRITDDGKTLELKNGSYYSTLAIIDLKGKDLTLQATNGSNSTTFKLKKLDK